MLDLDEEPDDLFDESTFEPLPTNKWQSEQEAKRQKQERAQAAQARAVETFKRWQSDPNPTRSSEMLTEFRPYIQQAVQMHVGKSSPTVMSKAKRITLDAMRRYDPEKGAAIPTYIISQLQGLKRVARHQQSPIKIPERDMRDAAFLNNKSDEFEDIHGYEPSTSQLADFSGISPKKIAQIRSMRLPVNSSFFDDMGGEDDVFAPTIRGSNPAGKLWQEMVYHDLSPLDQKIMEWTLGINGSKVLSTETIARRLRLSPGAISQRRKKIQDMLDEGSGLVAQ